MGNATLLAEEYGYVKDGKVFLKGYLNYPDRQIGEVKRTEQEAIDYFKNRFLIALNKVSQLRGEIDEAQNKGSYLTKLTQLRRKLVSFDAIGDFVPLLDQLDKDEEYLAELIQTNQLKNLEIKRALIEDAKAAAAIADWKEATDEIQEVKSKWIRTGPVDKELQEEIENGFQGVLDDFFHRRREFFSEQNRVIQERIDACEAIIKQVKQLNYTDDLDGAYLRARDIRNAWNNVGEIPTKKFFKLNKTYRHFFKFFYDKYNTAKGIVPKVTIDPRILEQQKLLAQAEEALAKDTIVVAADKAKVLLSKWKEIKIPFKQADRELAEKFRNVCDKIFELSYLNRVIQRKYPAFDMKSREEQLRTQTRELDWLIKREKNDVEVSVKSLDSFFGTEEEKKQFEGRINIQKRKIGMKEQIIREFQKELDTIV